MNEPTGSSYEGKAKEYAEKGEGDRHLFRFKFA
jgi:hypothetical protein